MRHLPSLTFLKAASLPPARPLNPPQESMGKGTVIS